MSLDQGGVGAIVRTVSLLPFAAMLLSIVLAALAAMRPARNTTAIRWFFLMNASATIWMLAYFVQLNWSRFPDASLATPGSWERLLAFALALGISATATCWFLFCATTTRSRFWSRWPGIALAHVPVVYTLFGVMMNPSNHLWVRPVGADGFAPGPLSAPHYLFTFALVISGAVVVIRYMVAKHTRRSRSQALVICATVALPLVGSMVWAMRVPLGLALPLNPGAVLAPLLHAVLAYEVIYRGLGDIVPLGTLSTIMENTRVPLAYLDNVGHFVSVNSAFAEASSHTRGELVGRSFRTLLAGEKSVREFEEAFTSEVPVTKRIVPSLLPEPPGSPTRYWDWTLSPVISEDGERTGLVLSLTEVTEAVHEQDLSYRLNMLDQHLHSGFVADDVLRETIAQAMVAIGAESAALVVTQDGYRLMQHCERPEAHWESFGHDEYPHLWHTMQTRQPLICPDVRADDALNPYMMQALGIRSTVAMPLLFGSSALGSLAFEWRSHKAAFSDVQVSFAERFCSAVATALENRQRYESERRIAQTLQESMLSMPAEVPGVRFAHVYRSATEAAKVGGDFYDIFELDNNKIGLLIGDVSGHGLEAAVVTSLVKTVVRVQAYDDPSPARVMERANQMMLRRGGPDLLVTAFYCVLDPATGSLRYCSAGHPPPLIARIAGEVEPLDVHSVLLGLMAEADFDEGHAELRSGDILVMYTDGLTEAAREGVLYGEERLTESISRVIGQEPQAIVAEVFDGVKQYSLDRLSDDAAVLAVRLAPFVPKRVMSL